MTLRFEPWRALVDAHAAQIAEVLADELGPIRGRSVEVGHDEAGMVAMVNSGESDRWRTAWVAVVNIAPLWEALDAEVAVSVDTGGLVVVTPPEAMRRVAGGCDQGEWRRLSVAAG
jgi:hypothetical protein